MKAYILNKTGGPGVLKLSHVPDPVPAKGEVLVRLHYTGINYAEILSRKGLYGWAPKRPYIPGMEGAGSIEQVGDGVSQDRIGQKVIIGTQNGCYAGMICVPAERAIPAPVFYTMAENAAFAVNYMTAWVALVELARLQKQEKLLVTAAAGGVGTAAVQLAAKFGCQVYGLAGSQEKIDLVTALGATAAFNYRDDDCFNQLASASTGLDVVLELVGGEVFTRSFRLLKPFGRLVVAGFASLNLQKWNPLSWWRTWRAIPRVKLIEMAPKSVGIMATHLGYLLKDPQQLMAIYNNLKTFVTENQIKPVIGKIFSFDQAAAAHAFIESRQSTGKVLLQH